MGGAIGAPPPCFLMKLYAYSSLIVLTTNLLIYSVTFCSNVSSGGSVGLVYELPNYANGAAALLDPIDLALL